MNTPSSASQSQTNSLRAPDKNTAKEALVHFITAFMFLIAGILVLVWNSERLSQGLFFDARVIGGLHFITLGWLSLSIFGALRVFTGVALGSHGLQFGLVAWIRRLWSVGTILFPIGLIKSVPLLIVAGVICIGLALTIFSVHIIPALLNAKRGGLTRGYLAIALISLWGTWMLGSIAASTRAGMPIATLPQGYLQAHVLLAVFGWVGATIVGVGSHLIPMFALSREVTNIPVKAALPVWGLLPFLAVFGAFFGEIFLYLGFLAAGVGSTLWIIQVWFYLHGRLRKEQDPGLIFVGIATIFLAVAWVLCLSLRAPIAFVGLTIIGWLTLFTLGIYHRVIPFLVWFMRFARNAGLGPVPKVKELINEKLGMLTVALAFSGVFIWTIGVILSEAILTYVGSLFLLSGCVLSIGQIKTLMGDPKPKAQDALRMSVMNNSLKKEGVSS